MRFRMLFIIWTCLFCLAAHNCCVSSDSDKLTQGLKKTEKSIPLPYHEGLETTVLNYTSTPFSNQFLTYSAFIDTALSQRNMPSELRYLPLALSGMRRNYCQGDRCGIWQLPTLTALHYGLTIDGTRDERTDVEASTNAALDCLNELYQKYGDWWPRPPNYGTSRSKTFCPTPKSFLTSSPVSTLATKANSSSVRLQTLSSPRSLSLSKGRPQQ